MKKFNLLLVVGVMMCACQKEEVVEEENSEVEVEIIEYFTAEVNGKIIEFTDPYLIKGTVYTSRNTGVINFDFSADFYDESLEVDFYKGFLFKVCFYDGPGTYNTGTTETVSWAMYFSDYALWENHYSYGNDPGIVVVTDATEDYVEGTFEFEAYNTHYENSVEVNGEFKLELESQEDYNKQSANRHTFFKNQAITVSQNFEQ